MYILLRFGELTLKGRNRSHFEKLAMNDIKHAIKPYPKAKLHRSEGRVLIKLNGEDENSVIDALQNIFGLHSFSPMTQTKLDIEQMKEAALLEMRSHDPQPKTFKVSVRRTNKAFAYDTNQLNPLIGGYVLSNMNQLKVDVHHPDVVLRIEVRDHGAFIYSRTIPGLKGFPYGSSGKGMLMLSGGIDSPVAGWLAMRRGLSIEAVHFHSIPYTSERAKQKVIDLTKKLAVYGQPIKLHMVPFTSVQLRLKDAHDDNLLITLIRRAMFRITEMLAAEHGAKAIVTGESLGQVASQTLSSLHAIGQVATIPILRPLIMSDKDEIIQLAHRIDTYETSILPYEDCCTLFIPKSPSTNPNLNIISKIEQSLPWLSDGLREAVEQTETLIIRKWNESEEKSHLF